MDSLAITTTQPPRRVVVLRRSEGAENPPILGFEAYLAFGSRKAARNPPTRHSALRIRTSCCSQEQGGYQNLIKLRHRFSRGYYRRPRIDKEVLERHHDGIIGWLHAVGEIALYLRQGNYEAAKASASGLPDFGPTASGSRSGPRDCGRTARDGRHAAPRKNWGCRSPRRTMRIT